LVIRVISEGAPTAFTSWAEKPVTRWNSASRTSRPNPMAMREPQYTDSTAKVICTSVTASMSPPVRQM
jgi:hypothetical protein